MWWLTWRAPVHDVVDGVASTGTSMLIQSPHLVELELENGAHLTLEGESLRTPTRRTSNGQNPSHNRDVCYEHSL